MYRKFASNFKAAHTHCNSAVNKRGKLHKNAVLEYIFPGLLSHKVGHLDQHTSRSDTVTQNQSSKTRNVTEKTETSPQNGDYLRNLPERDELRDALTILSKLSS